MAGLRRWWRQADHCPPVAVCREEFEAAAVAAGFRLPPPAFYAAGVFWRVQVVVPPPDEGELAEAAGLL